jgi:hypothetical protein
MHSQRFVQAEFLPNHYHPGMDRGTKVPNELPDKGIQLIHVNCHKVCSSCERQFLILRDP